MKLNLSRGCSKYGADMGRRNILPENTKDPIKLQMEKLKWVDGDYDQNGCYWGGGNNDFIYCAHADSVKVFVRAENRQEAKNKIKELIPNSLFYS